MSDRCRPHRTRCCQTCAPSTGEPSNVAAHLDLTVATDAAAAAYWLDARSSDDRRGWGDLAVIEQWAVRNLIMPAVVAAAPAIARAALLAAANDWKDIEQSLEATEELILDAEDKPFRFTPDERRRFAVCDSLVERAHRLYPADS